MRFQLLRILSFLPFWLLYGIGSFGVWILANVVQYRKEVIEANLKAAFPNKSDTEILKIRKAFYRHFVDLAMETLKSFSMNESAISKRFKLENPELLNSYFKENRSVILYTAHIGNWEWFSFLPYYFKEVEVGSFYQKLSSGFFENTMLKMRQKHGLNCVDSDNGYRYMLKQKSSGKVGLNCIIGDQSPRKSATKHWVEFLNQDTAFLVGANRIARKLDQVMIYPHFTKLKKGHYSVKFELISDRPNEEAPGFLIENYSQLLEANIKECPELWLWSHRRWKLKKEDF